MTAGAHEVCYLPPVMREIVLRGRGPNTMSRSMLEALERELVEANGEPVLLVGEGNAFSAGLDLDALASATPDDVAALLDAMERATRALFLYPGPTVAMINGHAVAGGCLLAQCCDHRIASDDANIRIGMTGVAIGLIYPPFVAAVFRARVPAPHRETVLLAAARYAPRVALDLALVDEIAPATQLRELAEGRLTDRAALPRAAYAAAKRALREPDFAGVETAHRRFRDEVVPSWTAALRRR